ncbi:MAG: hypothetical protein WCT03_16625 [Candidatus Obscuribacterales bacterium]|jgi:hypothetical protein
MRLKSLHFADLLKLNSALIAVLIFVVVSLTVRLMFEPTIGLSELPYSEFQEKLKDGGGASIERLDLQAGLTDFWGRDIAKVLLKDSPDLHYMIVPPDFYSRMFKECWRRKYSFSCCNYCLDARPIIQVVLSYACSFVLIAKVLIYKRRLRAKVT